ncbi:Signal transduction histidine kinase [Streptomyces sp. 1222.5]|nr:MULTISPECIES: sensor histidine kinase [unclassified Streptomyces]PKW12186.1 signal transduction histidine kinase [Streptomyces sp. 5112.2]SEB60941.1 Signal transduction histidine kinase [Streptomyces sp. 1222.5]
MPAGHPPEDAARARRGGPAPAVRGGEDDALDGEAPGRVPPRSASALWWGSAGLVLAVLGTSVLVAGADDGPRPAVAVALVLAQVLALRWQVRAPIAVLAADAVTGLAVWALLPAVTLTGALLAAQITLCVLSATRPRWMSARALAAMCLPAPLAFAAGGPTGLTVYLLTVVLAWTAGQWRGAQRARTRAETRRAVVEERARIAREVHDVVAHTLSVMVIQAGAADHVFTERPEQARQALRAIETSARSALGELRLLLRAFRPDEGEEAGEPRQPVPSLARLDELADTVRATGMTVRLHREGATEGLPAAVDLAAYRIVQEALTNTLRHAAGADEVSVRVTAEEECVTVRVVDNGRTPSGGSGTAGSGRGLVGMNERARLVGGSLRARPLPGGGFEVAARLPVERAS